MKIVEKSKQAYDQLQQWRQHGSTVGLVPTMGALHQGHMSLVEKSRADCDKSVVSIFVNPTQFGPKEDFSKYPRPIEQDVELLEAAGVDLLFVPDSDELYAEHFSTYVQPPALAESLEGDYRPDHFRGVTTIVLKLFNILPAHFAYFGQKDYQQLAVIKKMVQDLNVPVEVIGCPTIRDVDGLALSSRNRYLSADQRSRALSLSRALEQVKGLVEKGENKVKVLEEQMHQTLAGQVTELQYARVVDAETLEAIEELASDKQAVALIAAYVGDTRLIDNALL